MMKFYDIVYFSEPSHVLSVNDQFTSKLFRVKIQTGKSVKILNNLALTSL